MIVLQLVVYCLLFYCLIKTQNSLLFEVLRLYYRQ